MASVSQGFHKGARIVVAMSGGVDSSVAAALLKREGYDVAGVTLQLYDHGKATASGRTCCAGADIHDARRVAEALAIPHFVLDYEAKFRERVIEDFAAAYARGETPVPCVRCNERVKFSDLMSVARELGASALATGHYARRLEGANGPELHRAADAARDQSYFLFATTREQLAFLWFPLGGMEKSETRRLAAELGLAVAEKRDSQDICFVPDGRYARLVERIRPGAAEPGEIVDMAGRVLGRHDGVIHFTVGQRKGLGIATGEPLFVIGLDAAARRVVVGPRSALRTHTFHLGGVNWLGDGSLGPDPVEALARVRSTREPKPALVRSLGAGMAEVTILDGEEGVAPGQACVFYERATSRVLGGGWIRAMEKAQAA